MTTTKKTDGRQAPDAEKAKAVTKRAARPNIAAKKATPVKAAAKKADAPQSVIEPVAPKAEAPKVEAPKADKPGVEKFDACPQCGFHFTKPQAKCNSVTACERRQNGKAPRGTTSNGNGSESTKTSTITAMNAERQAMKDWTAGGETGERPATPLLDKIRADYAAKEAAKAEAAAARKAEVTPILKAVK